MHNHQHLIRCAVLLSVSMTLATSLRADDRGSSQQEQALIAVLRSDAPKAEKAITCKKLAIHGSSEAVADLTKLLPDPQLSSWARIALEAIPGKAADEALRAAADSLDGKLLVGTINSIGIRRDRKAAELLAGRLEDRDAEVASAAAVALGQIGNEAATRSLRKSLATAPNKVRSAIAEGCVLCAERLLAENKPAEAIEIYDQVRQADVPQQRIVEATRGAILARGEDGIALLMEVFQSNDKVMFQLALGTVREFPGGKVDEALAQELSRAEPDRATLMVQAMADRPNTVVLAAVLKAAEQGEKQVRISAIDALQRVGNVSCLSALLAAASDDDDDLALAAKETLAQLPGEDVDAKIVAMLPEAEAQDYALLLGLVGQRRIDAVPDLLKALNHSDQAVRTAALIALGETAAFDNLSVLISQVVSPKHPEDAEVAQAALRAASVRMPDADACAAELAKALGRAPAATKSALLEILSEVGGSKALMTLAAAAKSDDPGLQDNGSRLLGKWNSVEAAPVLLDLAKNAPSEKYRIRALRGYIGVARKFAMPEPERADMCRRALELSRKSEQALVLDVLKLHPSAAGLAVAIEAKQIPDLGKDARAATLVIAEKLGDKRVVRELLSQPGLEKVKLEIIKAEYGAGSTQKDVTATLRKQVRNLPLITLPSKSYNACFGGDPAPGTPKKLKVQYRINGKAGEASFAENALILLPMPK